MQQDNEPKHIASLLKKSFWWKMENPWLTESVNRSKSNWICILHAEEKTEGKKSTKQAGTEDDCSTGLAEHHQGRYYASMRVKDMPENGDGGGWGVGTTYKNVRLLVMEPIRKTTVWFQTRYFNGIVIGNRQSQLGPNRYIAGKA